MTSLAARQGQHSRRLSGSLVVQSFRLCFRLSAFVVGPVYAWQHGLIGHCHCSDRNPTIANSPVSAGILDGQDSNGYHPRMAKRKRKSSHGGPREGAGRPPLPDARRRKLELRLSDNELARLATAASAAQAENLSGFARAIILRAIDR